MWLVESQERRMQGNDTILSGEMECGTLRLMDHKTDQETGEVGQMWTWWGQLLCDIFLIGYRTTSVIQQKILALWLCQVLIWSTHSLLAIADTPKKRTRAQNQANHSQLGWCSKIRKAGGESESLLVRLYYGRRKEKISLTDIRTWSYPSKGG